MKVTVIGTGEAFDSGLGNNAFVLDGRGVPTILVDCGYQIPERLWATGLHRKLDGIYLTHTHADHSFGIVPLIGRFLVERRERPLPVIGHSGVGSFVRRALDLGYPGMRENLPFPLEFITVSPARRLDFGALSLACARSDHGVLNLSVRFECAGSVVRVQRRRCAERRHRGPLPRSGRPLSRALLGAPQAARTLDARRAARARRPGRRAAGGGLAPCPRIQGEAPPGGCGAPGARARVDHRPSGPDHPDLSGGLARPCAGAFALGGADLTRMRPAGDVRCAGGSSVRFPSRCRPACNIRCTAAEAGPFPVAAPLPSRGVTAVRGRRRFVHQPAEEGERRCELGRSFRRPR